MTLWLTVLITVTAPLLEVREFPAHGRSAEYFMAPMGAKPHPGLFCLDGDTVYAYPLTGTVVPSVINLPEGTSAVDAFDLNGDGAVELIAIAGRSVLRIVVSPGTATAAAMTPQELFKTGSQFADAQSAPFLHVLGVVWQGQRVLGIPDENDFVLYDARGEVVARWPIGVSAPPQAALGRPFTATVSPLPSVGPPGALEMRVRREIAIQPVLPEALPIAPPPAGAKGYPAPAYTSNGTNYLYWPAFNLLVTENAAQPEELRRAEVLYAFDTAGAPQTVVRLQTPGRSGGSDAYRVEPEARFPGMRLGSEFAPPDFNRDGFADLLLWRDAAPMPSISRFGQALAEGTRPVRITVHLFEPKRRRFAAEPTSYFSVDVPTQWFSGSVSAPPLHYVMLADFNGDGTTDFAMATGEERYAVWLYGERGFGETPDWEHAFESPLEELLFHGNFLGKSEGLALRTHDRVYTLLPPVEPLPPVELPPLLPQ